MSDDSDFKPGLDSAPDQAPGGPADAIKRDPDDFPIVTPDGPVAAEKSEKIPDALEEPEDTDEAEPIDEAADNGSEEPA